jgi:hypothetical protein
MARTSRMKVSTGRGRKQFSILTAMVVIGMILFSPKMQVQAAAVDDNSRPTAVISGTMLVYEGATVYLNGNLSSNPAGNAINYRWALVSSPKGSAAIISGGSDAHASFTANVTGVYQVQLIVNNGSVDSKPAYATITVIRHPYMW